MSTTVDFAVARLAASRWGVVTYQELLACGLSPRAIEVRVRRGNLFRLYRGVYAVGNPNLVTAPCDMEAGQRGHFPTVARRRLAIRRFTFGAGAWLDASTRAS